MPRWWSCTCAWVQASVTARSKAVGSWCLSARSSASLRDGATSVQNATRAVAPGGIRTRRRRLKIGSSTVPTVLESGRPSITEIGVRMPRPRPRKRARSVSNCTVADASRLRRRRGAPPRPRGSPGERRRRVARRAPTSATNSVCTNSLEKAGCAASAAGGASTTSAYEVSSISRARLPRFEIETRRTSASSSGETATSSVVVIVPSRRTISARSSENATS